MSGLKTLPSYDRPPVIEVALSVQFEPLAGFDAVRMALLWQQFRSQYPTVEQKPPISSQIERLGVVKRYGQVDIEFLSDPGTQRLWFVGPDGNELIQVQADRFVRNWRRTSQANGPYPRYEDHVRPRFVEDYQRFKEFLNANNLASGFRPNQCEATYINDIRACDVWSSHSDFHKVFAFLDPKFFASAPEPWETTTIHLVRLLKDQDGKFLGRLHIEVQSLLQRIEEREELVPIFRLTLTARGRPTSEGDDGVMGFLDYGRSAIVNGFDQVTTAAMHDVWGKRT